MAELVTKNMRKLHWITLPKVLLIFFLFIGGFIVFFDPFEWNKQESVDLRPLESKIQNLQEKIRHLEEKISTIKSSESPSLSTPYQEEKIAAIFLFQRLVISYYQGQPYKNYLEKLLALPKLHLEKSEKILWLLDPRDKKTHTIESLLALLENEEDPLEKIEAPQEDFWSHPIHYIQSHMDWKKLFIIQSAKESAMKKTLKDLITQREFSKALKILPGNTSYAPLQEALESLIKTQEILNTIEEKIFNAFFEKGIS